MYSKVGWMQRVKFNVHIQIFVLNGVLMGFYAKRENIDAYFEEVKKYYVQHCD